MKKVIKSRGGIMKIGLLILAALLLLVNMLILSPPSAAEDRLSASSPHAITEASPHMSSNGSPSKNKSWWARLQERQKLPDPEWDAFMKYLEENQGFSLNDGGG